MTVTRVIADLDCPECAERNEETVIETALGPIDTPLTLHVGDREEGLDWGTVRARYLVLREPAEGEPVRLIETWWCEGPRWVELTLTDDTVTGARDVSLNRATVGGAHAITDEVAAEYYAATGESLGDLRGGMTGFRERLLEALPD
jgi:hypothetical protein